MYSYQLDLLDTVMCSVQVEKSLPTCEHVAWIACSEDPASYVCQRPCNLPMGCCGRTCNSACARCQQLPGNVIPEGHTKVHREKHVKHQCQKLLYCGHICGNDCTTAHECTRVCKKECRQQCKHSSCKQFCSALCSPCKEPCPWYARP